MGVWKTIGVPLRRSSLPMCSWGWPMTPSAFRLRLHCAPQDIGSYAAAVNTIEPSRLSSFRLTRRRSLSLPSISCEQNGQERPDHTLQSTALVHEAYLKLMNQGPADVENRAHFLAVSSRLMRQILVDHARRHRAAKRGGGLKLELKDVMATQKVQDIDLIALDHALSQLARLDPQQSRVVEMRFFGGLSIEDTAEVIGISRTTVKREWATARAWLLREMSRREARA
jgi:RNA polymerase sigma-70 factor (ECF subfamily)